jgi:site-specific recombinase XerD
VEDSSVAEALFIYDEEEIHVGRGLSKTVKHALLRQIAHQYQNASAPQKKKVLEGFLMATGYVRKYAIWLLNHASEELLSDDTSGHRYGPEVLEALVLAWKTLNQICAKRLIPFLPSLLESLEQYGYLQLSEEHRRQLLSMSAATADRLLQAHRQSRPRGVSTTKAGSLLKQQIPVRTFAQWDEVRPGFLEADLVVHCGGQVDGGCLYTLTLTDVATGWTECLPLHHKGREAVLSALHRARPLFPFPILGIDTDNGGEFINEEVAAYCEREQITFTRGRPYEKRDQCFVEQKNGIVVRQIVGYGHLMGDHACRQLAELYRALHWYVNCFQPSMKLVAKQVEGRKIHRVYDAARTPLQRLLLSGVLPASKQEELGTVAKGLDPIRLFQQVEQLQQAVFHCERNVGQSTPMPSLRTFALENDLTNPFSSLPMGYDEEAVPHRKDQESLLVLNWRRTSKDPFAGQWEQILSWVQVNPSRSSGDIFRELQSLFPGRYQPQHLRTLQRGMRHIRVYLLQTRVERASPEVIQSGVSPSVELHQEEPPPEGHSSRSTPARPVAISASDTNTRFSHYHQAVEELSGDTSRMVIGLAAPAPAPSENEPRQVVQSPRVAPARAKPERHPSPPTREHHLLIKRAIQWYLQAHRKASHEPKTLEWHQTALRSLQQYLLDERQMLSIQQITETDIRGWMESLRQTPTPKGSLRSARTIETYARSVRAFCTWLVQRGDLARSPMSEEAFPRTSVPLPDLLPLETFEQFVQARSSSETTTANAKRMAARDRAILWVLFDTGITVSEMCALRLCDVDQRTGILNVRSKGGKERQMTVGPRCLNALRSYLKQAHPTKQEHMRGRTAGHDPLFCSEQGRPLTKNSVTLLFGRLRRCAEMHGDFSIGPQILRHSFALRYLQAGGDPRVLQELLGYAGMAQIRQYLHWHDQLLYRQRQKGAEETG